MHKKAFTLAEILITLVVIGVIASLTIPALIQRTQYAEFVAAMKKSLADFNQAANLIKIDNGLNLVNAFGNDNNSMMQAFCNKMNCVKQCPAGSNLGACFENNWKDLNGAVASGYWGAGSATALLSNGNSVYFSLYNSSCKNGSYKINGFSILCGYISVDVNGVKGPNIAGRDIFIFAVTQNGVLANNSSNTGNYMSRCDPSQILGFNGDYCATRVLIENGMKY